MEIQVDGDWETIRRHSASVVDGPILKTIVYPNPMLVTGIRFDYTVVDGQWITERVIAFGPLLKKDGTPGLRQASALFTEMDSEFTPLWIVKAAEHYRPKDPAPEDPIPFCVIEDPRTQSPSSSSKRRKANEEDRPQ
jgi:hypothetical protein